MACKTCTTIEVLMELSDYIEETANPENLELWDSLGVVLGAIMDPEDFEEFCSEPVSDAWLAVVSAEDEEVAHL